MYENKYNIKINYKIINFQNFLLSKHLLFIDNHRNTKKSEKYVQS